MGAQAGRSASAPVPTHTQVGGRGARLIRLGVLLGVLAAAF